MYEKKDADGHDANKSPESGVIAAVTAEIQKLGDNSKANYEALRTSHEELKAEVTKAGNDMDVLAKEKIDKLAQEVSLRQDALDKKYSDQINVEKQALTQRLDALELSIRNSLKASPTTSDKEAKDMAAEARKFWVASMAVTDKSANFLKVKQLEDRVEDFQRYQKEYEIFLRCDERHPLAAIPEHLKALQVGIDPDGGYTVTPQMSTSIIQRLFESDPIRQLANIETISTSAYEQLVDFDEAGAGWEGETETGAETDTPQIFKKRIPVHVLYAKPQATQTLLEDSAINVETWLAGKVARRFGRIEAAAFVTGNGVGRPRGFLTYPDYTTAGEDEWGRIERQNMGLAAALTADGFIDVKYRLIEEYLNRGTWLMNRLTVADTMQLKDGEGRYIWKPGLERDNQSTLLGLPVRMSTTMPTVEAGALAVAIADWREAYTIVDRLGITVQRDPYTAKPFVEFYTRKRVGADVVNPQAIKIGVIAA